MNYVRLLMGIVAIVVATATVVPPMPASAEGDVYLMSFEDCPKGGDCTIVRCATCPPGGYGCELCEFIMPCNDPQCLPEIERASR